VGWVGVGFNITAGAGGQAGGWGEGVERGPGGAGDTGCRDGTMGAMGIAGSESITVSSHNLRRFTAVTARPRGSRGEGGTGEGEEEGVA